MKQWLMGAAALVLAACGQTQTPATTEMSASEKLDAVLAAQSDETKARYQYRHPKETLEFFGVKPGMTVVDTLPGEPGWYAPILAQYLGPEGRLIGADYPLDMWALFENQATPEFMAARQTWTDTYTMRALAARGPEGAAISAYAYGSAPEDLKGQVDVVLMMRALHHFNRLEPRGGYFTKALREVYAVLKPGGIVGVVQHRAPAENADAWADGSNGYLKQDQVIAFFENAGFEFLGSSEINANPKDHPTEEEFVWRLPPSTTDNEKTAAIGESDRMTLKFRKPE